MSVISRYQKPGGFETLVRLLETCGPKKRSNLLNLIHAEDPYWAALAKGKMLNMREVLSWPAPVVSEVFATLSKKAIGHALIKSSKPELRKVFTEILKEDDGKEVMEYMRTRPTNEQFYDAESLIFEMARKLNDLKVLNLAKFSPHHTLSDPDDYHTLPKAILICSASAEAIGEFISEMNIPALATESGSEALKICNTNSKYQITGVICDTEIGEYGALDLLKDIRNINFLNKVYFHIFDTFGNRETEMMSRQLNASSYSGQEPEVDSMKDVLFKLFPEKRHVITKAA